VATLVLTDAISRSSMTAWDSVMYCQMEQMSVDDVAKRIASKSQSAMLAKVHVDVRNAY